MKRKNLLKRNKSKTCQGIPQLSISRGKSGHAKWRCVGRIPLGLNFPSIYEIREMISHGSTAIEVRKSKNGNRKIVLLHNIGYKVITDRLISTIISVMQIS